MRTILSLVVKHLSREETLTRICSILFFERFEFHHIWWFIGLWTFMVIYSVATKPWTWFFFSKIQQIISPPKYIRGTFLRSFSLSLKFRYVSYIVVKFSWSPHTAWIWKTRFTYGGQSGGGGGGGLPIVLICVCYQIDRLQDRSLVLLQINKYNFVYFLTVSIMTLLHHHESLRSHRLFRALPVIGIQVKL